MNGNNDVSVVVQEMNNFDFNFDEKYVVLESVLCGNNDILHVARAIFNNKDDAEFYVNHSLFLFFSLIHNQLKFQNKEIFSQWISPFPHLRLS